jgi:hypothetical protein
LIFNDPFLLRHVPHPLLNLWQGIEGTHISYHPEYSLEDDDPLKGITFVVSSPLGVYDDSINVDLPHPLHRLVPSRLDGTDITPRHLLHCHIIFRRESQSPRFRTCQSCPLRCYPGHAEGRFLISLKCRLIYTSKGLPNTPLSTRTRI